MSAFTNLMVHGTHRHVILQAHANLGLDEEKPWGGENPQPWKKGDLKRFEAELIRIASNPQEVADAVERFEEEVIRRAMAESEARTSGKPLVEILASQLQGKIAEGIEQQR